MAELHLCDLVLLKVDRGTGCSVTSLALRQRSALADLTRLLPRLAALQFGELDARVVPDSQGYRLRLLLLPRQRSLLLDPRTGRATLESEAELLRNDIERVGLRVLRAARAAKSPKAKPAGAGHDLMHELLVRRAQQQWRFAIEHQQIELAFPDCPRYAEDDVVHRVVGLVHAVTERHVVLKRVEIWTLDASPRTVARVGRLWLELSVSSDFGPVNDPRGHDAALCGRPWSRVARLNRCVLTSAIVGAIEVTVGGPHEHRLGYEK
jgi:hypothetical protein